MNSVIVLGKGFLEKIGPKAIQLRESLTDQSIELGIRPFLRATFNDHRGKFRFLASGQRDLHQLMATFFKIYTRHDGQVDCASKINEVSVALIFDIHLPLLLCF